MKHPYYENRELSWLRFNGRVLEEAGDERVPLLERLSFLSIFQSNLDEFFMVRVGSLHDQTLLRHPPKDNKTGMTAEEQLDAIMERTAALCVARDQIYCELMERLAARGICLVDFRTLSGQDAEALEHYFKRELLPLLSAGVVGKKQPFPFLKNQEIYAVAVLQNKKEKEKIGIVPCSGVFDRLIPIPSREGQFILAEELILHFIPKIYRGYKVTSKTLARVTRNADIDADRIYDEDLDYREHMAEVVRQRRRLCPVRLELSREMDEHIIERLCTQLQLSRRQVFGGTTPLELSFMNQLRSALHGDASLSFPYRVPQKPLDLDESRSIIAQVGERDRMLFFPYESYRPFLTLLHEAACDPQVESIQMTLYRLASESKVIEALSEAAENGKRVDVLVELKARFDEENNIEWSHQLEDAGCHVIYGIEGLKVHCKLCQITRRTAEGVQYITQIGTGNYNEKTARLYTDLSLMTADQEIGREAAAVFAALLRGETVRETDKLLVAPHCLQNRVLALIDEQIDRAKRGKTAYIGLKLNSLTDKTVMERLIEASSHGVRVELLIRGICCLRGSIPGQTENIRVRSIVGRYLEHSRIYIFGAGDKAKVYIASADLMTRNTLRRVELAVPVLDDTLRRRLLHLWKLLLRDNVKAREQTADGTYRHLRGEPVIDAQELLWNAQIRAGEELPADGD